MSSDNRLTHPLMETKAQVIELALLSNVSELKVSFVPACTTPDWHSDAKHRLVTTVEQAASRSQSPPGVGVWTAETSRQLFVLHLWRGYYSY